MKHYKIVNLNESIIQEGGGGLTVLSYNVSWEAMTSNTSGKFKLCTANNLSNGLYFYQVNMANSKAVTKKFVVNK